MSTVAGRMEYIVDFESPEQEEAEALRRANALVRSMALSRSGKR